MITILFFFLLTQTRDKKNDKNELLLQQLNQTVHECHELFWNISGFLRISVKGKKSHWKVSNIIIMSESLHVLESCMWSLTSGSPHQRWPTALLSSRWSGCDALGMCCSGSSAVSPQSCKSPCSCSVGSVCLS